MVDLALWNAKRKELKMSLATLAEITEISISTIKDIFRGATTDPRIETVQRIEKALGIEKENPLPEMTEGERAWVQLYHTLTDENRDLLVKLVTAFKDMPPERRRFVLDAIKIATQK